MQTALLCSVFQEELGNLAQKQPIQFLSFGDSLMKLGAGTGAGAKWV